MKQCVRNMWEAWRSDYYFSTMLSTTISTCATTIITLYNGILGIMYHSLWHGSICVYYLFLAIVRIIILSNKHKNQRKIYIGTHILLLLIALSMIVPIIVMTKGERNYTYGLIPAIAMAVYTTYRTTMGTIHFYKSKKKDDVLTSELRTINFSDALFSVLSLQNILIIANGGMTYEMKTLTFWTSCGILSAIIVVTIMSFAKVKILN